MVKSTMTRAVVAEVEELIREIAAKHGIAVGPDDPIFVLHTINQRLLADSAKAQQVMLDRYKEEMEVIAHAWSTDAKSKAERVLNASLAASKETMVSIMTKEQKPRPQGCVRKSMPRLAALRGRWAMRAD
jgi:hypothetical protein